MKKHLFKTKSFRFPAILFAVILLASLFCVACADPTIPAKPEEPSPVENPETPEQPAPAEENPDDSPAGKDTGDDPAGDDPDEENPPTEPIEPPAPAAEPIVLLEGEELLDVREIRVPDCRPDPVFYRARVALLKVDNPVFDGTRFYLDLLSEDGKIYSFIRRSGYGFVAQNGKELAIFSVAVKPNGKFDVSLLVTFPSDADALGRPLEAPAFLVASNAATASYSITGSIESESFVARYESSFINFKYNVADALTDFCRKSDDVTILAYAKPGKAEFPEDPLPLSAELLAEIENYSINDLVALWQTEVNP